MARQYEAQIAALPGVYEMVQLPKKIDALKTPHSQQAAHKRLLAVRQAAEQALGVNFKSEEVEHLDVHFFPEHRPQLASAHNCAPNHLVSGRVTGLLGSLLFCTHQETSVFLPLKKYIGYPLNLLHTETKLKLPAQQISLF